MGRFKGWDSNAVAKLQMKKDYELLKAQQDEFLLRSGKNKYGNKIVEYNGVKYQSAGEAEYAKELDLRVKIKDIKSWRRQVPFTLIVNGTTICKHIIDFEITHNDGSLELIEYKGYETKEWTIKRKLFRALYPQLRYRIVRHQNKR